MSSVYVSKLLINSLRHYKAAISRYATLLDTFDSVKDTARQVCMHNMYIYHRL